ncbi:helix-turn-helix domain-containing protein [Streptomyces antimicrobicus]|uniref:Helix-turn-helix domain-containing protein n=1 Tax=Streptomyces antimicrobicus TaxID=2883108 RepID=A0ABS8BCU1_9ACTN|nr:helix-turn-helix domain-containing protein [Streptomyces antimicrobicus]MCB5182447.1 helix-turn-helix domain-containing protein [Streptomyces antimicrobicus]
MHLHTLEVRQTALSLLRSGVRNAEVARRLDVPVGTVGYWKHLDRATRGECPGRGARDCARCHGLPLDHAAYAYLLGLYLGDGHISKYSGHRTYSLMITLDDRWPGVQDDAEAALRRVFPEHSTCRVGVKGAHNIKVYSNHLPCLFPQHGPGRKHERRIALEPWQQEIVDAFPWEFVRGLIHSDGCRTTNWTVRNGRRYEYPRYWFTNVSDDIRKLFTDTLDRLGVVWTNCTRHGKPYNVSVARKASVALMDAHVGPKH